MNQTFKQRLRAGCNGQIDFTKNVHALGERKQASLTYRVRLAISCAVRACIVVDIARAVVEYGEKLSVNLLWSGSERFA